MRPNRNVAADGGPLRIRTGRRLRLVLSGTLLTVALWSLFLTIPAALAAPFPAGPDLSISLLSPSSGQGPVGATLTVTGGSGGASQVTIGAATSTANCADPGSGWVATFGTASQDSGGAYSFSFTWPASLTSGTPYALCAAAASGPQNSGGVAAPQTYTVRSAQPPTLSLSSSTVQVGQPFTITGSNFYGMPTINVSINNVFNQTASPDGNGSFIVTVTPTASQAGNANILAQSPAQGNAKPVLTATAQITILAAPTATPVVTPSPSASPSVEASPSTTTGSGGGSLGGGNTGGGNGGGNGGLIIGLIIAIVLVLLLIGGAVVFLVLRRRGGGGPEFPGAPGGGGGPGSGGGWGGTGPVPQYGQTGRYGATGAYGSSGFYGQQDNYAGPQMGGVASWDDAPPTMGGGAGWDDPGDSVPGPDWQPRPMSNSRRRYDDPSYPPYAAPEDPSVDPYGAPATGGYAPPPDPWGSPPGGYPGSYSNPTQGYAPPGRGGTGYPPIPPRRQPPGNWSGDDPQGDDRNPGAGRGPGGTNPTNQGW